MKRNREQIIESTKSRLLKNGAPRFQMMLILIVTGAAGFFVSYALLHLGVMWMWLRYPIAILLAYGVFLLLLRLWLAYQQSRELEEDLAEASDAVYETSGGEEEFSTGDPSAGGGGWDEASVMPSPSPTVGEKLSVGESSGAGGFGFDLDLDEGWLVIAAILIIGACLVASLYVVYVAPALLAEILVDSLLVTGLYRRLRKIEKRHWLEAAVRKTLLPVLLTAALFTAAGWLMQKAVPEARSVGEVWRYITNN